MSINRVGDLGVNEDTMSKLITVKAGVEVGTGLNWRKIGSIMNVNGSLNNGKCLKPSG